MTKLFLARFKVLFALLAIFACGTLGYYLIEKDWTLFDSFYMTAITITTVGYGEVKPLSEAGRIFSIFLIFIGLGSAAVFATQLAKTFLENNFKDILGINKMNNDIRSLKDHFIVCGFGDIGFAICSALHDTSIPFVVIEGDEDTAGYAMQRQFLTIKGKATYDTTLIQAGIRQARGIVICLGEDSLNIHVSLAARELNPDIFIIARGYKSHIEKRMVRAGANTVVNPLQLGGAQIAELIISQYNQNSKTSEVMSQKASVMGYALKMYQHFQEDPKTIAEVKSSIGARQALKLRKADGVEIVEPTDDLKVENLETVLFLLCEDEHLKLDNKSARYDLTLFEWSDDYRVDVKVFDDEHQRLFELCYEFINALNQGKGREKLSHTFDKLIDYTCFHFTSEESYFARYDYPEMAAHVREHQELTQKVLDLNKNKTYIFPDNVADFLYSWLKGHILECDMKYADFFRQKGVR